MLTFTLLVTGIVGLFILLPAFYERYCKQKRVLWLQAFAKVIRFSFHKRPYDTFIDNLWAVACFGPNFGHWHFENLLVGQIDDVAIEIFDYYSLEGQQDIKKVATAIRFTSDKLQLPNFALRPKTVLNRNHPLFGETFIPIKGNHEFFQNYIVQTDDKTAVRALFDEELCNHFARLLSKSVEGKGKQLIYLYEGHLVSHERVDEFLEEAMQVFNLFAAKSKVQAVLQNSYDPSKVLEG